MKFAQRCSDEIKVPLVIGVLTNNRMEGKVRLYRRQMGVPAGAFFVYGANWTLCDPSREDFWKAPFDERRKTNGNYTPGNCYWADRITQANNTRANRVITVGDCKLGYAEACAHFGVPMTTVASRISRGWPDSMWFLPKGTRR